MNIHEQAKREPHEISATLIEELQDKITATGKEEVSVVEVAGLLREVQDLETQIYEIRGDAPPIRAVPLALARIAMGDIFFAVAVLREL